MTGIGLAHLFLLNNNNLVLFLIVLMLMKLMKMEIMKLM